MEERDYIKQIAKLESVSDQLQSELNYLNEMLRALGFEEGIKSLKEAAKELLNDEKESP